VANTLKDVLAVAEVATKKDVQSTETALRNEIKSVHDELKAEIKSEISELRSDMKVLKSEATYTKWLLGTVIFGIGMILIRLFAFA
jgi:DNA repair exonuclease SbcCD ATPase subunit